MAASVIGLIDVSRGPSTASILASLLLGQLGKFCGVSGTSRAMAQRAVNFNLIPEKSTNRCITNVGVAIIRPVSWRILAGSEQGV
jgi:hypothetical protein